MAINLCNDWEAAIARVFATGDEQSIEFSYQRDAQMMYFHSRLVPEISLSGEVGAVLAITRDLTDRQRAEEHLARKAEELARSNAELEGFAYIASHDLKEPLRGIANYAHFLMEDYAHLVDAEGRHKLQTLKNLAARMDRLLDALLEYSRVGRTELAIDQTDLGAVVDDVVASLRPRLDELKADVRITPLPTARCDRIRVRELLSNLVTNAFKYNEREKKVIEIGEAGRSTPLERVIYVKDNGIGIPAQHQARVFEMFKRLHGRDKFGGGTGSGLAIAKRIVERHGGKIWVESTPGEGTTFYFSLPQRCGHHD
jgi:two-component system, chemotaxis family, sensor kinase Cph1